MEPGFSGHVALEASRLVSSSLLWSACGKRWATAEGGANGLTLEVRIWGRDFFLGGNLRGPFVEGIRETAMRIIFLISAFKNFKAGDLNFRGGGAGGGVFGICFGGEGYKYHFDSYRHEQEIVWVV